MAAAGIPGTLPGQDWLRRARSGDERAYLALCEDLLPGIYAFALDLLGESQMASRIAIDALLFPLLSLQETRGGGDLRVRVYRQAAKLVARERASAQQIGSDASTVDTKGLIAEYLARDAELETGELALVLGISGQSAGIIIKRVAQPGREPGEQFTPLAVSALLARELESHWPDRQPPGSARPRKVPARQPSRFGPLAISLVGAAVATSLVMIAWSLLRTDDGANFSIAPATGETPSPTAAAGLFPVEVTRVPTSLRPSATPTRTPVGAPTPPAVTPSPTILSAGVATTTATPTVAPSSTATSSPTPTASPTPPPAPSPTATSQPCNPRLAANVSSVALVPGNPSFFFALNQAQCGSLAFTVLSNAAWLSATAANGVIAASALVAVNLVVEAALLPGTGEGTFVTTVSLTGADGGGAASVQVTAIQPGAPPVIASVQAVCTGSQVNFTMNATDDFGIVAASVRYSLASGPVTSSMVLVSGSARSGTWSATIAKPSDVQGWAVTATDGAGASRSVVVTPSGCS